MTLRVGLRIEGDASSAKAALGDTTRGLDQTADAAKRQGKSAQDAANDNAALAARVKQIAEQLQFETQQLGRNAEAQAVHNALRRAGVSATSAEGQQIAALAAKHASAREAQEKAAKATVSGNEAIEKLTRVAGVAGGQVGGLVSQVGGLFIGASKLGGVVTAVTVGLGLLAIGTYKSVTAFAALEAQQARTAVVLQATGNAAGQSTASLERNAAALGRVGTQSLDDIRAASTELLRYRITSEETFKRALDSAQGLANTYGGPLKDAVTAFGQAYKNPVEGLEALKAAGLRATSAQTELVRKLTEGGESAKAFNEILRIAKEQMGGANAKSADTLTAAYGRLSNTVGTVAEHVGKNVAEWAGLKRILDSVNGAVDRYVNRGPIATAPVPSTSTYIGTVNGRRPSADALSDLEADKLKDVTKELDRQTAAARLNETAQAQLAARQLAGVDAENSQRDAIRGAAAAVNQKVAALAAERFAQQDRAAFITTTANLKIEAETLEKSAGFTAAYRYEQERLADAKSKGIPVNDALLAQLKREGAEIGDLTQKTAALRLETDLAFERAQLGRSDSEQRVAQTLRSSGIDAGSADGQRLASQIRLNEALKTGKDLTTDFASTFTSGFKSELRDGATAWDAFRNAGARALDSLSDKLLDMATKNLVAAAFGGGAGGGGGIFSLLGLGGGGDISAGNIGGTGGLFAAAGSAGAIFDKGGYTGPGGKYEPAGVVHRGEYVFDQDATNRIGIGNLARLHKGYAAGGYVGAMSIPPATMPGASNASGAMSIQTGDTHITIQGSADKETLRAMREELARRDAQLPNRIIQTVRDRQKNAGSAKV